MKERMSKQRLASMSWPDAWSWWRSHGVRASLWLCDENPHFRRWADAKRTHDESPRPDAAPGLPAEGTVGSLVEETEEETK